MVERGFRVPISTRMYHAYSIDFREPKFISNFQFTTSDRPSLYSPQAIMSARSSRSIATLARSFSTSTNVSAGAAAAPSEAIQAQRRKGERPIGVKHAMTLKPFEFNDIPWLGWLKMFKMRQALELGEKVRDHEAALRGEI